MCLVFVLASAAVESKDRESSGNSSRSSSSSSSSSSSGSSYKPSPSSTPRPAPNVAPRPQPGPPPRSTATPSVPRPAPNAAPAARPTTAPSTTASTARSTSSPSRPTTTPQSPSPKQQRAQEQAARDRATLDKFPEIKQTAKGVSPIVDRVARDHAIDSAKRGTNGNATVTSQDRGPKHPLHSPAHDRGAVDVTTPKDMPGNAAKISKETGRGYLTIHEQPKAGPKGQDVQTYYKDGKQVGQANVPPRATKEHIHVQPDFNSRLHNATAPPPVGEQKQPKNTP
ncbi:MAG: hypothetical protein J0J01_05100 [Reyranella sp.]|uniref:hypothetical protein n=1 Tax=Reyranella sp. TaxID=1929291 RepID=UPI001ACF8A2D|nr:hypothetical protein [Reyranella sp.]MBN9086262.1 hypothetical protein [Reyranella sp.]